MARRRIYDAAFDPRSAKTHHAHLAWFAWIEGTLKGEWNRQQAHDYAKAHRGEVYVREAGVEADVEPWQNTATGVQWIQTKPDGRLPDNLLTLAERHDRNLPNP